MEMLKLGECFTEIDNLTFGDLSCYLNYDKIKKELQLKWKAECDRYWKEKEHQVPINTLEQSLHTDLRNPMRKMLPADHAKSFLKPIIIALLEYKKKNIENQKERNEKKVEKSRRQIKEQIEETEQRLKRAQEKFEKFEKKLKKLDKKEEEFSQLLNTMNV